MNRKSQTQQMTLQGGRVAEMDLRPRFILALFLATVSSTVGCGKTNAAPAVPSPEVEVAKVVQGDVPIVSEWVATLDGYVNAQIQAQVAGYVVAQKYKEGSLVRKGQILF
ncbi:MAG TPA: biotin/lipoyl-binding protein, partial [Candidatus Acidoferrum sp.]|nr:biotin/lipoyl-binding protein [Candidatus Acidoferrum sp.]